MAYADTDQQRVWVVASSVLLHADSLQGAVNVLTGRGSHPRRLLDLAHVCGHVTRCQTLHCDPVVLVLRPEVSTEFGHKDLPT